MRFDLHIHSNYSHDSNIAVEDILIHAIKKQLDGIAICDHNTLAGSYHAIRRVKELDLPLIVIPGEEVSTTQGHLLVLGVRKAIPPNLTPSEAIGIARKRGGVVIAPHPFRSTGIGNLEEVKVDAIETFNSRCIFGENKKAKKLAQSLGKPEVGGSDSHLLETIGLGFTEIDSKPNEKEVLKAILEGRTRAYGRMIPWNALATLAVKDIYRKFCRMGERLRRI